MTAWATARTRGHLAVVDGFRGVVTATFPRTIYVTPPIGDLLVVHHAEHGPTPTSLLVDDLPGVAPGDVVVGRAQHLRLGDVVVDARTARIWSPPPAPRSGIITEPIRPAGAHVDLDLVRPLVDALCAVERSEPARVALVEATLRPLVGRGVGLTPSGDDAIVGILAVLHRCAAPSVADGPLHALAPSLPPLLERTTPISAHFLRLALRGQFSERLVSVVDACCTPSGPTPEALDRLLATGATSGADAFAGVVAAHSLAPNPHSYEDVA